MASWKREAIFVHLWHEKEIEKNPKEIEKNPKEITSHSH